MPLTLRPTDLQASAASTPPDIDHSQDHWDGALRLIATTWRDLPNGFGPFTTCYNRFVRCRFDAQGVLRKACERTQAIRNPGDHAVGFGEAFKKKLRALSDKGLTHHASAFREAIAQF
jgi:transposase